MNRKVLSWANAAITVVLLGGPSDLTAEMIDYVVISLTKNRFGTVDERHETRAKVREFFGYDPKR